MPYTAVEWSEDKRITATRLDVMDTGVFDAYYQSGTMFLEGTTASLTYTSGNLTRIDETVATNLRRRSDLSYTGSDLTSVRVRVYADNGTTVIKDYTDTLTYSGGNLNSVSRVVTI